MEATVETRLNPIPEGIEDLDFDLILIGAGINGSGVARDAALRGLRVLLLEKGDLASGTSGRSARMIHGGLRYLEHRDFGLVRESLRERATLLRIAPHLVRAQPLLIPLYEQNQHRLWQLRLGLTALDLLAALSRSRLSRHRMLSRDAVIDRVPGLDRERLLGAGVMPDAYAPHGERLCVENALAAATAGATVVTHAEVESLTVTDDRVRGVAFRDRLTGRQYEVMAPVTLNVAGPWVDRLLRDLPRAERLIGGTKGSFLVVDPFPGAPQDACFYEALSDKRQLVVVPWNGFFLVGTTDLRFEEDPGTATVTQAEVDYLLDETNRAFPSAALDATDIRFSYAGVRPLPYQPEGAEGTITRKHIVFDHAPETEGLVSVVGGKFSTFRSLAQEAVDLVFQKLGREVPRCTSARTPFPGAAVANFGEFCKRFREDSPLGDASTERLLSIYGTRSREVLELAGTDEDLLAPFDGETGAIGAEVVFASRREYAETLIDILAGRTLVAYDSAFDPATTANAVELARRHLGWDERRCARELSSYGEYAALFQPRKLATVPGGGADA